MATPSWRSSPVFRLSSKPANRTVVSTPLCESKEEPSPPASGRDSLQSLTSAAKAFCFISVHTIRSQSQLKQTASIDPDAGHSEDWPSLPPSTGGRERTHKEIQMKTFNSIPLSGIFHSQILRSGLFRCMF